VSRRKGPRPPVELLLDRLDPKGVSGVGPDGQRRRVGAGGIGARVLAVPDGKETARVQAVLAPAPDRLAPPCPVYGQCGGCQLQEVPLHRQRSEKQAMVERIVGAPSAPVRGAPAAYGTRNKIELSWSTRAFFPERVAPGADVGHHLGFHPPGWFQKVVPVRGCDLASPAMSAVVAAVADAQLRPAWDPKQHQGVWRHLVVREGRDADGAAIVAVLVTTSAAPPDEVAALAQSLRALPAVRGVAWRVHDGAADVATGALAGAWGDITLPVQLAGRAGALSLLLDDQSFFQVNADGAAVLFDTIAEALWGGAARAPRGTLVDLYCGVGAIGLYLGAHVDRVLGIELSAASIEAARRNAGDLPGRWEVGPVEALLPSLWAQEVEDGPAWVVVDPPRVGLHARAADFLAGLRAEVLVYVACNPSALARDRVLLEAGGWRLDGLWTVDLFPQTRHVEAVARFVRADPPA
jgi:23S rRNA (uracil1939-C5)-methyltransferase